VIVSNKSLMEEHLMNTRKMGIATMQWLSHTNGGFGTAKVVYVALETIKSTSFKQ
jgi:hypothetical protein